MRTNNLICRWLKLSIFILSSFLYGLTAHAAAPSFPPTSFTLTANLGEKSITVSCKDSLNTNVTYYIIQRRVNDGNWDNNYATATAVSKKITYVDTSLSPAKYDYRVVAHNDDGNSPATAIKSATIVTVPNAPVSLTAEPNNLNGTVSLNWVDASSDETGFIIQRQVNGGTWDTQYATVEQNITTYLDSNLASATYNYRVCASSANGNSGFSNEASAVMTTTPASPTSLALSTNGDNLILNWTDNSTNETAFQVERRIDNGTFAVIGESAANVTTWTSAAITGDHTYYFRVRAYNATGYSLYSNVVAIFRSVGSFGFPEENQAPVITALSPVNVYEGEKINLDIVVTDVNTGDTLTLNSTGLPSGASLTKVNSTWILSWNTNFQSAGTYPITFTANDGTVNSVPVVLNITVNDAPTGMNLTNKPEWFTVNAKEGLITSNLTWIWNAFVHPANISFVYEYSLNGGAWTETTETSYTATSLSEGGNQSFRVRVKLLTTPAQIVSPDNENADSFGIDNTPPTLLTLALNEGSLGTNSQTVYLSLNFHDSLGQGSGIISYEASIDGAAYAAFTGTEITLPSDYGNHTVTIRAMDQVGYVSNIISDDIILARNISTISGTSSDAEQVVLKDLRSNLEQTEDVSSGAFQFSGVPDGIYGLVLKKNNVMKGFEKRISIHDGVAVDLGEIAINSLAGGSVSGELMLDNVPVAAGIDLGLGLFLKVNETLSSGGSFTIVDLAPGTYTLKALPQASTKYFPAVAEVSVASADMTYQNLSLTPGNLFAGSSNAPNILIQLLNANGKYESTFTDSEGAYSMVVPSGDYDWIVKNEYYCALPLFFPVNQDSSISGVFYGKSDTHFSGTLTNTAMVFSSEMGINKTLQVNTGDAQHKFLSGFSAEYGPEQTTWNTYIEHDQSSSFEIDSHLYLLSDDMAKGIHSQNRVDATNDSGNFTVNSAGGSLSGVVTLYGNPVVKPQLVLFDSSGVAVGICQGSKAGEYFFKHVPAAAYTLRVTDTEHNLSIDAPSAIALEKNTVVNVEFVETTLAITDYETTVSDGAFNASLELSGLDENSTYEVLGQLYTSDWKTRLCQKKFTVSNGQFNLEIDASGVSGTNCHFLLYLFKDGRYSDPKVKEVRNNINVVYLPKKLSFVQYDAEVADGLFNVTLELARLDETSTYELLGQVYSSDWKTEMGQKKITVTNGQVNLEISTAGFSGTNCHFLVYLFKDKNYSYSNPEVKEVLNNINVAYTPKILVINITHYETEVADGLFSATLELAGLNETSTYEILGQIYSSDWKTQIGQKKISVTNGQVNLEISTAGYTGSNCHFLMYLFKDKNYSYSNPEVKEVKNYINIS